MKAAKGGSDRNMKSLKFYIPLITNTCFPELFKEFYGHRLGTFDPKSFEFAGSGRFPETRLSGPPEAKRSSVPFRATGGGVEIGV